MGRTQELHLHLLPHQRLQGTESMAVTEGTHDLENFENSPLLMLLLLQVTLAMPRKMLNKLRHCQD